MAALPAYGTSLRLGARGQNCREYGVVPRDGGNGPVPESVAANHFGVTVP